MFRRCGELAILIVCTLGLISPAVRAQSGKVPCTPLAKSRSTSFLWGAAEQAIAKQTWTDVEYFDGWRVQLHALSPRFRLADRDGKCIVVGDEVTCRNALRNARAEFGLEIPRERVVILLHGMVRSRDCMESLRKTLANRDDWTVINWQYASTRGTIEQHAECLAKTIQRLEPNVTEVNFVAHSMGNLVLRKYLASYSAASREPEGVPHIHRIVMLGPPNQGSTMARLLGSTLAYNLVCGTSGQQLARSWDELEPKLATPQCEFGIVAGGQIAGRGWDNWLLDGPDDFTVSVAETTLAGACDSWVVPAWHGSLMRMPDVHRAVRCFLESGFFNSAESRQPLVKPTQENP